MKNKIDIQSALVGLVTGILAMAVMGAVTIPKQTGRYQIAGTGNHGLVLDTITGQVWSHYFPSNGGSTGADFFQPKFGDRK